MLCRIAFYEVNLSIDAKAFFSTVYLYWQHCLKKKTKKNCLKWLVYLILEAQLVSFINWFLSEYWSYVGINQNNT